MSNKKKFFDEYYTQYFNQMKIFAYSVLRNWEQAEEVTQEVFLTAWRRIDTFMESPNPLGWLINVSKFTLKNVIKHRNTMAKYFVVLPEALNADKFGQYNYPDNFEHNIQNECKDILSEEEYYILRRSVLEDATYQEIADELGITIWACQKRMQRLLKKLRNYFRK